MAMPITTLSSQERLTQAIGQVVQPPKLNKLTPAQQQAAFDRIKKLCIQEDAVIIAHYYVDAAVQAIAEATGGFVGDSLEMARFGQQHPATTLIIAGVHFMGETAKILSPEKRVLVPDIDATCSLDLGCPIDEFSAFCDKHPERTVVVYANTSAAVKARADWVVTSSIALDVVRALDEEGESILWAPDRHLGRYLAQQTGADMLLWDGACIVHEAFKVQALCQLQQDYPDAAVLVHPESPQEVVALADVVGSTSQLLAASITMPQKTFIVATERGIFYKMQQKSPEKTFVQAPTGGAGATCRSCIHCPWMAKNDLDKVEQLLKQPVQEIKVDPVVAAKAMKSLNRMVEFT